MWVMLLSLGACAIKQSPLETIQAQAEVEKTQKNWQAHQTKVSAINGWRITGKIAVKAGSKGGHASLRWDKQALIQHIEIFGPLGGGRVVIDADSLGARLKDTKGDELQGDSVAKLIEQRLGWPLPFDQLPDWLRGLPASENAQIQWDEQGKIERMNDHGWQVSYPEYQMITMPSGEKLQVPRKIELNALPGTLRVYDKNGDYLGEDFFVRLIIKTWQT